MKRPIIWMTVGYITGIIWGLYFKISIVPIFFVFGGLIYLYYAKNINIKNKIISQYLLKSKNKVIFYLSLFLIFTFISNIQITYLEKKHENLYKNLNNVEITGTIISSKKESTYQASYTLKVETINGESKYEGTCLILYTKKDKTLEYGDKIDLKGSYEKPKGATNYKAFDYKEYLKEKNIYGIIDCEQIRLIEKNNLNPILMLFNSIREKIKLNLMEILGKESQITIGILLRRYV